MTTVKARLGHLRGGHVEGVVTSFDGHEYWVVVSEGSVWLEFAVPADEVGGEPLAYGAQVTVELSI